MTEGRVGRLGYFGLGLASSIPWIVLGTIGMIGTMGSSSGLLRFAALFYLGSMVIHVVLAIKRLHDLDRPGTDYLYMFIPFYNVYLAFVLLFQQGTVGPNRYGSDPVK